MTELKLLPCGCEYDADEDAIYWGGQGPGGCTEHRPAEEQPPAGWKTAVLPGGSWKGPA